MARPRPRRREAKAASRIQVHGGPPQRKTPSRKKSAPKSSAKPSPTRHAAERHVEEELDEKGLVREALLELTRVHFEEVEPHPAFPLATQNLEWFMRCRNREEIAIAPYLNAAWKEKDGRIWLESLAVGDTIDWIELAYGDERATQSLDLDYSRFEDKSFQAELERRYPIVMGRIREYENIIGEVAKRNKVRLELRRAGSRGMLVFTIAATIERREGSSSRSLRSALEKSVSALREAHDAIGKQL